MPSPAETETPAATSARPASAPPADEVFVRAIDLPTLSLRQARAAVANQLDILSPLPPAEVAAAVVLLGPTEAGLHRYAVGLAPRRLLAAAPAEGRTVSLIGRLEDQVIVFRFERPGAAGGAAADWLEIATIAGACLAIVLAGANLRVDREIDAVQAKIDAADATVQERTHEVAAISRVAGAWRAAAVTRRAGLVDCALTALVKANGGGSVKVAGLAMAGGQFTARLAEPPTDSAVAAMKTLGLTAAAVLVAPSAAGPAAATTSEPASAPAPAAPTQDFQTSAAACR